MCGALTIREMSLPIPYARNEIPFHHCHLHASFSVSPERQRKTLVLSMCTDSCLRNLLYMLPNAKNLTETDGNQISCSQFINGGKVLSQSSASLAGSNASEGSVIPLVSVKSAKVLLLRGVGRATTPAPRSFSSCG